MAAIEVDSQPPSGGCPVALVADVCKFCRRALGDEDTVKTSPKAAELVHRLCFNAYKALRKRMCGDPHVRPWFDKKTPEEQAAWYAAEYELSYATSKRRKLSVPTAAQSDVRSCGHKQEVLDRYIPFDVYEEKMLVRRKSDEEIREGWAKLLGDPAISRMKVRGGSMA